MRPVEEVVEEMAALGRALAPAPDPADVRNRWRRRVRRRNAGAVLTVVAFAGGAAAGLARMPSAGDDVASGPPPAAARPTNARLRLLEADALVELDDVTVAGDLVEATVSAVHFRGRAPDAVAKGRRVVLFNRDLPVAALADWHVVLADVTDGGKLPGPRFAATLAIRPDGRTALPADAADELPGIVGALDGGYSAGALGDVLAAALADPASPPPALLPRRGPHTPWASLAPSARTLDEDTAPADVLVSQTKRATLRLDVPADIATAGRQAAEPWVLRVVRADLGVVYAAALSAGAHDFPVHLPSGSLDVYLVTERGSDDVAHLVGTIESPVVVTANGPERDGTGPVAVAIRWRDGATATESWSRANPFRLG